MALVTKTRSELETQLARMMGDASSAGVPAFAKWGLDEYRDAINFGIKTLRKKFLIPYGGTITWTVDTFNYSLPDANLAYIHTIRSESGTPLGSSSPVVGTGMYEYWVPMEIVTPQRLTAGSMNLHFDKNEARRHNLNQDTLKLLVEGYTFQPLLTASADECKIDFASLLLTAKQYLHISGAGRDPNDLMKHMRQWQAVVADIANYDDEEIIEVPGGIWVDGR